MLSSRVLETCINSVVGSNKELGGGKGIGFRKKSSPQTPALSHHLCDLRIPNLTHLCFLLGSLEGVRSLLPGATKCLLKEWPWL